MGTGKSTAGAALALRLGVPFVDADLAIASGQGAPAAELLRRLGEEGFRAVERAWVREQLADGSPRVVALGGGALLHRPLRLQALRRGTVLCLRASPAEIARRLEGDRSRPLLAGADAGRAERAEALLAQRAAGYAEAHGELLTDGLAPDEVARRLAGLAARADLVIAAGEQSYPVRVEAGRAPVRGELERLSPTGVALITDRNVERHQGAALAAWVEGLGASRAVVEPGEGEKNEKTLQGLWRALLAAGLDRRGVVLGAGGGVVTDLAGFAAGTWLRGVRWVAAPTTLLGMVDAALGGKTAIDLGEAKNQVGVLWHPSAVCCGVEALATEPERSYVSGLAEAVKSALVGDAGLLDQIEREREAILRREPAAVAAVVRGAAAVKAAIVSRDEREQGDRRLLNLGHTLGHALESYGGFARWTHGEAVSLGMVAALRVGEELGVTEAGLAGRVEGLLSGLGLPTRLGAEAREAFGWMRHDKKREGAGVHYVLVERAGQARCERLGFEALEGLLGRAALR